MDMSSVINTVVPIVFGAIVSVVISTIFARRELMVKTRILTTLDLYTQYQSNEMVTSRNQADKILKENEAREQPLSYNELYNTLPVEEYDHVARILYFFTQIADLHKLNYLDDKLVRATFARYFKYWHQTHFHRLWEISKQKGEAEREWVAPMTYLANHLKLSHMNQDSTEPKASAEPIITLDQVSKQAT